MDRPVILFRTFEHEAEAQAAARHIPVLERLDDVRSGDLVIGRFSLVPFYEGVEGEIASKGGRLLVPYADARYIAQMGWLADLREMTPATWFASNLSAIPADLAHGYFVKGVTNSRKHEWQRSFAATSAELPALIADLASDPLIGGQEIVVREFRPLATYGVAATGLPITDEYRYFVLDGQVLSCGYYWDSYVGALGIKPDPGRIPAGFVAEAIARIPLRHYVMDIALTAQGEPLVVEINDPGLSGLAGNDPDVLYAALARALT